MVMNICVLSVVAFFSGPACAAPGKQKKASPVLVLCDNFDGAFVPSQLRNYVDGSVKPNILS